MTIYLSPLVGGLLIGLSSTIVLMTLGRITGISGIYSSLLNLDKKLRWEYFFIAGLLFGGGLLYLFDKNTYFSYEMSASNPRVIMAGILVGFGTRLGSGCTSGHGVCGIPRISKRSIVATIIFIITGMIVVSIERMIS